MGCPMACSALPNSFHFPALRSLGDLADYAPRILIDTREQTPLVFSRLESVIGTLATGDYSVIGLQELFAIERKSIDDLVGCCMGENRLRFERELHRLRGFRFKRLLVVGSRGEIEVQRYHSRISPKSVLGSLAAWECRFDLPVVFAPTPTEAADQIERWAWYFAREVVEATNNLWRAAVGNNTASDLQQDA
jgi:DNA excision repair protein ERCC-4